MQLPCYLRNKIKFSSIQLQCSRGLGYTYVFVQYMRTPGPMHAPIKPTIATLSPYRSNLFNIFGDGDSRKFASDDHFGEETHSERTGILHN